MRSPLDRARPHFCAVGSCSSHNAAGARWHRCQQTGRVGGNLYSLHLPRTTSYLTPLLSAGDLFAGDYEACLKC